MSPLSTIGAGRKSIVLRLPPRLSLGRGEAPTWQKITANYPTLFNVFTLLPGSSLLTLGRARTRRARPKPKDPLRARTLAGSRLGTHLDAAQVHPYGRRPLSPSMLYNYYQFYTKTCSNRTAPRKQEAPACENYTARIGNPYTADSRHQPSRNTMATAGQKQYLLHYHGASHYNHAHKHNNRAFVNHHERR